MANQVYESNMQPYGQQQSEDWGANALGSLIGRSPRVEQMQNFNPEQNAMMNQAMNRGWGSLGNFDFAPIEAQARQGFQQTTVPGIAERFTALGGGQRSSAFSQALGQAGAGLETNLAAMKQNYNLQQMPAMLQLMQMGLTPRYDYMMHPGNQGVLQTGINAFAGGLGGAIGSGGFNPMAMLGGAQKGAEQESFDRFMQPKRSSFDFEMSRQNAKNNFGIGNSTPFNFFG